MSGRPVRPTRTLSWLLSDEAPALLTLNEAAEVLGRHPRTIRRLLPVRTGENRGVWVPRLAVLDLAGVPVPELTVA